MARTPPTDAGRIDLAYQHRQRWWFDADTEPEAWRVSADVFDDSGTHRSSHVGDIEVVRVDLDQTRSPFGVLDGEDAELGRIAEVILDPATGRLDPTLDAQLEPLGCRLLILKSARLTPAWRGFGLGVLLAGIAIKKPDGASGPRSATQGRCPASRMPTSMRTRSNKRWPSRACARCGRSWASSTSATVSTCSTSTWSRSTTASKNSGSAPSSIASSPDGTTPRSPRLRRCVHD